MVPDTSPPPTARSPYHGVQACKRQLQVDHGVGDASKRLAALTCAVHHHRGAALYFLES